MDYDIMNNDALVEEWCSLFIIAYNQLPNKKIKFISKQDLLMEIMHLREHPKVKPILTK